MQQCYVYNYNVDSSNNIQRSNSLPETFLSSFKMVCEQLTSAIYRTCEKFAAACALLAFTNYIFTQFGIFLTTLTR